VCHDTLVDVVVVVVEVSGQTRCFVAQYDVRYERRSLVLLRQQIAQQKRAIRQQLVKQPNPVLLRLQARQ
jgi:hypothetical protein